MDFGNMLHYYVTFFSLITLQPLMHIEQSLPYKILSSVFSSFKDCWILEEIGLDGEGSGNPLQWSCLENPRDWGAWWAAVYGIAESWTRLKRLSSSSSSSSIYWELPQTYKTKAMVIDKLINSFIDNCQTTDRVY